MCFLITATPHQKKLLSFKYVQWIGLTEKFEHTFLKLRYFIDYGGIKYVKKKCNRDNFRFVMHPRGQRPRRCPVGHCQGAISNFAGVLRLRFETSEKFLILAMTGSSVDHAKFVCSANIHRILEKLPTYGRHFPAEGCNLQAPPFAGFLFFFFFGKN